MKNPAIFFVATLLFLSSCSSQTVDEPLQPNPNGPKQDTTDQVSDWTIEYDEISYQNEDWTYRYNTSAECVKWREAHQYPPGFNYSNSPNHNDWVWWEYYPNTKESVVIGYIDQFIKWTLAPEPNEAGLSGTDTFTATLTGKDRDYSVQYSYDPTKEGELQQKWTVVFHQQMLIKEDESLLIADGFDEWVEAHKDILTHTWGQPLCNINIWQIVVYELPDDFIESQILPFVRFSRSEKMGTSYNYCTVAITQEGTGITKKYEYTNASV